LVERRGRFDGLHAQRDELVALAEALAAGLACVQESERAESCARVAADLRAGTLNVLFVGERSSGKSTIINAMLGREILPTSAVATTAVICRVKWGLVPQTIVRRKDGRTFPIDVSTLAERVTVDSGVQAAEYAEAVLCWPLEVCHGEVEILDTPGLNAGGELGKAARAYLATADAVVVVVDCQKPGTMKLFRFIDDEIRAAGHHDIFFICNKLNLLHDEKNVELVKADGARKLAPRTMLRARRLYYVDALAAVEARAAGRELGEDDELLRFERDLAEYLAHDLARVRIVRNAVQLKRTALAAKPQFPELAGRLASERADAERRLGDVESALRRREVEQPTFVERIQVHRQAEPELRELRVDRDFLGGLREVVLGWSERLDAIADALDQIIIGEANRIRSERP
jgi:GTPase SAR1 family protein